jgi:hypothetical protein
MILVVIKVQIISTKSHSFDVTSTMSIFKSTKKDFIAANSPLNQKCFGKNVLPHTLAPTQKKGGHHDRLSSFKALLCNGL